jgi:hypothetical protein
VKKRKFKLKRKAWVEHEIMESGAFRGLPGTAMWILLRFMQKQTWSSRKVAGRNIKVYENSSLTFTYSEAKHFDISSTQFYRSIKTLIYRGFLDIKHRGGSFGIGCDYTTYKISNRWREWGDDPKKPRNGFENVVEGQFPSRGIGFAARKSS